MFEKFYPKEYVDSIYHVDYARLWENGVRSLIFDIDNTIEPFNVELPTEEDIKLMKSLEEMGFSLALVSNNSKERVELFNKSLGLKAVHKAGKPKLSGVKKAMEAIGGVPESTAFLGDQVFTDMFVANRMGFYPILVKPISDKDEFTVKLKRGAEGIVIRTYLRKYSH